MKKILLSLAICVCCSLGYAQSNPLEILLVGNIDTHQNIIGLSTVEYLVINNSNLPLQISKSNTWIFTAKIGGKSIDFSQREGESFDDYDTSLPSHDTMRLVANLNLFDFKAEYNHLTGLDITTPTQITIQASLRCNGIEKDRICYSEEIPIIVYPLEKTEQEVFKYIKSIGYDPYRLTTRIYLTSSSTDPKIPNAIISKYPNSTFAELASLSLAYQQYWDRMGRPEEKANIQHLLEKPLQSKYSFVRYLAEELLKKQ